MKTQIDRLVVVTKTLALRLICPIFLLTASLPVDLAVADRWSRLVAQAGRPLPAIDGLSAATALEYGLRLVTRNQRDFELPGLEVINSWDTDRLK